MKRASLDILIEVSPAETRAAWVDRDGVLRLFEVERAGEESDVGAIHLGRVTAMEKGARTALVDIGTARPVLVNRPPKGLHEGAKAIVQVTRDGRGAKGPAGSLSPVLEGRGLCLLPGRAGIDWPRQFGKGRARAEMETKLARLFPDGPNGIRPLLAGLEMPDKALAGEFERLVATWTAWRAQAETLSPPAVLKAPPRLIDRALARAGPEDRLAVDDRRAFAALEARLGGDLAGWAGRIAFKDGTRESLFDDCGVTEQVDEALSRIVALKGGGRLVFDRAEALVAIDVDLAAADSPSDDAILRLNQRAAREAARHILLRNLAGLIVIDFVRLKSKGQARLILDALKAGLRDSPAPVDILGMTAGGLVEITRQRIGPALDEAMLVAAGEPAWNARALAADALRRALKLTGAGKPVLRAPKAVLGALDGPLRAALEETNRRLGQDLILIEAPRIDLAMERGTVGV